MKPEIRLCDLCGEPMGDEAGFCHRRCWDQENFLSQLSCLDTIANPSEEGASDAHENESPDPAVCDS